MYKWLRDNNKQVLAFVMVGLMVAFLLPSTFRGCQAQDVSFGTVFGERVYVGAIEASNRELSYLHHRVALRNRAPNGPEYVPFTSEGVLPLIEQGTEKNKMLYYLLQQEAHRLGVTARPGEIDELMQMVGLPQEDGRIVSYDDLKDTEEGRFARYAVGNAMAVQYVFLRATQAVKLTRPQMEFEAAISLQSVQLRLVPVEIRGYLEKVSTPTAEQLAAQFKEFADKLPNRPTKDNPFGFGYRFPDRVKVQAITLSTESIRKAVLARKSDYDWDVEARRYYAKNQALFPSTQPTTQPGATPPAQPYEAVKAQVLEQVLQPEIDRLQSAVVRRLTSTLNDDYQAYAKDAPTTGPSTAKTSLGPPYDSFEYLQALSADLAKQFAVEPSLYNGGDQLRSVDELRKLKGLNTAVAMVNGRPTEFAEYVIAVAEALHPNAPSRDQTFLLKPFQPSQTMSDTLGAGATIIRITAADPSHVPGSVDEVKTLVEDDVRRKLAFEAAVADAQKLLEAPDLENAARAAGRTVIDTKPVNLARSADIPELPLTAFGQSQFRLQAVDLLAKPSDSTSRPRTLMQLPYDNRAVVAELRDVSSPLNPEFVEFGKLQLAQNLTMQLRQGMAMAWFDYDAVVKRVGYKDPAEAKRAAAAAN